MTLQDQKPDSRPADQGACDTNRKDAVKYALVATYLAAIVAANEIITHKGPTCSIYTAFVFIGLDLVTRDRLHDYWRGHVLRNMALLIASGSALSYALNRDSGRIALASCVAFGAAATVDGTVYHLRRKERWADRSNESNVAGAAVDSLIFPAIAFGTPILWAIVFGQFCAKVAGGYLWSLVLRKRGNEWHDRNKALYGHLGK